MSDLSNRRPLKSRGTAWARGLAARLAAARIGPDLISFMSLAVAFVGAGALALSGLTFGAGRVLLLLLAVLAIQLRLLCNLLDGMVAVEHGRAGPLGPLWNELPDRFADILLLAGAGYGAVQADAAFGPALGWLCAALAVVTAYVRELGRSLGFPADFSGPMAKPHRMAALTAAAVLSTLEPLWRGHGEVLMGALAMMSVLTLWTVGRRVRGIAKRLKG
jgi:phosphatidylglycerophosphate synthase